MADETAEAEQEVLELIGLYEDQDEDAIWARRVAWANEGRSPDDVNEWTDVREGSFFHVVSIGGVREDARIYDLMGTEVVAAASPLFAWETYLDAHAEVQALGRAAAVAATGEVTFTGTIGAVVDAGTEVGVEPVEPDADAAEFATTETVTLVDDGVGGGTATVAVEALAAGVIGTVPTGAITQILTEVTDVDSVTNAEPTVGGSDTEDDARLRNRLLEVFGGGGGWNVRAFRIAALAYGNGIGRVTVIPRWNGPTTVKVIVATESGDPVSQATVDGLQAFLDPIAGEGHGEVMVGLETTVETIALLDVTVGGTGAGGALIVELEEGYSLDGTGGTRAVGPLIELRVTEYVEAVESGEEVVRAQVVGRVTSVIGVRDVGTVHLNGLAQNLAVSADPAQAPNVTAVDLIEGAL